jgi:hypothetical protein
VLEKRGRGKMYMYLVEMEGYLSYFNYHITLKLSIANPARGPLWLSAAARFLVSKCGESIKDSAGFISPFVPSSMLSKTSLRFSKIQGSHLNLSI